MINQEPIFILGAHKSGTSLLRNLLDGHPNLYVVPFESHFFQNAQYWVDYEYRRQRPVVFQRDLYLKSFVDFIHERNTSDDMLGGGNVKGMLDESLFLKKFSEFEDSDSEKKKFEKYIEAIHLCDKKSKIAENTRVVEKSVINAEFAVHLTQFFPKAKFIHIVRNPYSNILSLRKFKQANGKFPFLKRIINSLYNSYYHLYNNQRIIKEYHILKYEDLLTNTESVMRNICDFASLEYNSNLIQPSHNGQPWFGNSTSKKQYIGVQSEHLNQWKNEISGIEVHFVNKLFPFLIKDFGYESVKDFDYYSFARKEKVTTYVANRILKYYT